MAINPDTKKKLMQVSTATLCTALFKRGLRNQYIQDVHRLNPSLPNMVGEAFTLRYIPAREDLNQLSVFQDRTHPQRVAVEQCPEGAVLMIDSRKNPRAASAESVSGIPPSGRLRAPRLRGHWAGALLVQEARGPPRR